MCGLSIALGQRTTSISFFSWYVYQTTLSFKSFSDHGNACIHLMLSLIGACKIVSMEMHNFKLNGVLAFICLFLSTNVSLFITICLSC